MSKKPKVNKPKRIKSTLPKPKPLPTSMRFRVRQWEKPMTVKELQDSGIPIERDHALSIMDVWMANKNGTLHTAALNESTRPFIASRTQPGTIAARIPQQKLPT